MILLTFVARISDGLPLVATFTHSVEEEYKSQAKQILRGLNGRYVDSFLSRFIRTSFLLLSSITYDIYLLVICCFV